MTQINARDSLLVTSRLTLRELCLDDATPMASLVDDPEIARMTTAIPTPYPAELAAPFIDRVASTDPASAAIFAVDVAGHGFAGLLGFHPTTAEAPVDTVEIGYWLGRPFWGQGYMTEAVCAALGWAAGPWRRRHVLAGHFADNPASAQVLIKAGFLYTGEVMHRFSLGRGESAATRMMVWLA